MNVCSYQKPPFHRRLLQRITRDAKTPNHLGAAHALVNRG
jgi:hypothetical protein